MHAVSRDVFIGTVIMFCVRWIRVSSVRSWIS